MIIPTWQATFKETSWAVFTGLLDSDGWEGLYKAGKEFLWYVFVFAMRVVMLLTFPMSIPLLFVIKRKIDRDREKAKVDIAKHYQKLHKH